MKRAVKVDPVPRDLRAMVAIVFDALTRPGVCIEEIADRRLEHVDYLRGQLSRLYDHGLIRYAGHSGTVTIDKEERTVHQRKGKINPEGRPIRSLEPHPNLVHAVKRLPPRHDLVLELERIVVAKVKD